MSLRDNLNPLVDELLRVLDETPAATPFSSYEKTMTAALELAIAVIKYRAYETPPDAAVLKHLEQHVHSLDWAVRHMRDRYDTERIRAEG